MAELQTINNLQQCMLNIKHWMDRARLKMNPSKTKFIYFGFNRQLDKCSEKEISVAGDLIIRSNVIRYLRVWMDSSLNFKTHTTKKCQSAMINFLKIRKIRHLLNTDTTVSLCLSLYISHLDYCNAVLYNIPKVTLAKLQHIARGGGNFYMSLFMLRSGAARVNPGHGTKNCKRMSLVQK